MNFENKFAGKVEIGDVPSLLISGSQYLVLGEPIRSEHCGPVCPFLSRGAERKEAWTDIDKGRPMAGPCLFLILGEFLRMPNQVGAVGHGLSAAKMGIGNIGCTCAAEAPLNNGARM